MLNRQKPCSPFPVSTYTIQILNELPTDKDIIRFYNIDCYAQHTWKTTGFWKNVFLSVLHYQTSVEAP